MLRRRRAVTKPTPSDATLLGPRHHRVDVEIGPATNHDALSDDW